MKVMVTITVDAGGGKWGQGRTLTLANPTREECERGWLNTFPDFLARALAATPDPEVEDDDDGDA